MRSDRDILDSAGEVGQPPVLFLLFVVSGSWLVGNARLPIRPGSPGDCWGRYLTSQTAFGGQLPYKGSLERPAVTFDHSRFRMMVSFYEPRTTSDEPRLFSRIQMRRSAATDSN